jgi:hypothetical protein
VAWGSGRRSSARPTVVRPPAKRICDGRRGPYVLEVEEEQGGDSRRSSSRLEAREVVGGAAVVGS